MHRFASRSGAQHFYFVLQGLNNRNCIFAGGNNEFNFDIIALRMNKVYATARQHQQKHLKSSSDIFRALAHPLRIRICAIIDDKNPACVQEIYDALQIEQSVASQHLRILRQANLVHTRREGKFVYYLLDYPRMQNARKVAGCFAEYVG